MDRKTSYKHSPTSEVAEIREKKREEEIVLRKQRRKNVVFSKRARCEEANTVSSTTFTVEQVGSIGLDIQVIGSDHLELLKQLKKAFAEDLANIDAFLSIDGAFQSLISLLTCNNPGLQLEASWCMTNIAAGKTDHAMLALKHASPYLIVYLQGHSAPLQDQCSWALGNIACEGPEFREILIKQGAIQPLINLLQSPIPRVIQSAAFAISNFISGPDADISIFVNGGIAPLLLQHVNSEFDNLPVLAEIAWVLMYTMASGEFEELLISHDAIPKLASVTCLLASAEVQYIQALTPLVRCLGNLCSGPTKNIKLVMQNGCILTIFPFLVNSQHRHIRKESLWLLSNLLVDVTVCSSVGKIPNLILYIVQRCEETFDIQKEALVCLCNMAYSGRDTCEELLQQGAIQAVIPFLTLADPELLTGTLNFCNMMLMYYRQSKMKFEEFGFLDRLDVLANHNIHIVQELAQQILDHYFYEDDDMEQCSTDVRS